jgi:hypothetical protein
MGNLLGGRRLASHLGAAALSPLLLLAAACGGGDENSANNNPFLSEQPAVTGPTSTEVAGLRPCAESRHVVAFDVAGLLTVEESIELLNAWNQGTRPTPRPGTPEVASAYRDRGYEVLYLVGMPSTVTLDDVPVNQALDSWLLDNGYPTGVGTHYWFWDAAEGTTVWTAISNELLRFAGEGATIDAGYTENPERAYALATGGVKTDRLFTLESMPVENVVTDDGMPPGPKSTPLVADDFNAHLTKIEELPPVCILD